MVRAGAIFAAVGRISPDIEMPNAPGAACAVTVTSALGPLTASSTKDPEFGSIESPENFSTFSRERVPSGCGRLR